MSNYNTGTTGTLTAATHTTSFTLTVPAGVLTGDVMIVNIEVFTQPGSSNSFSTPSSGGGNWTQIGPTLTGTYTGGGSFPVYGMAWYRVATAADAGSTFTMTYTGTAPSPDQVWWSVDFESYTSFYTTAPIGNVATFNNGNSTIITAPSTITTAANSWEIDTCPVAVASSGTYLGTPLTNRHQVNTQGINSSISDSNASVGAAGTSIGGGQWSLTAAVNNSGMAFTIELRTQAPAAAAGLVTTPHARGAQLPSRARSIIVAAPPAQRLRPAAQQARGRPAAGPRATAQVISAPPAQRPPRGVLVAARGLAAASRAVAYLVRRPPAGTPPPPVTPLVIPPPDILKPWKRHLWPRVITDRPDVPAPVPPPEAPPAEQETPTRPGGPGPAADPDESGRAGELAGAAGRLGDAVTRRAARRADTGSLLADPELAASVMYWQQNRKRKGR